MYQYPLDALSTGKGTGLQSGARSGATSGSGASRNRTKIRRGFS